MSQESAELKVLRAILDKLDKIERLQALGAVRGTAKEQDKIELLDTLGFKGSEIDRLLGKSAGYSAVVLYQLKKKKQPKEDTSAKVETPTLPEVTAP